MKLGAEHLPLSCSLAPRVWERFTDQVAAPGNEQAMELVELLEYLKRIDNFDLTPLEAILVQTEAIGDPALPTTRQSATLHWLGLAWRDWEQRFPLEEPLASQLRPLKPLAAALAITDPNFFTAGSHPLHQLLDTLQTRAIGWQPRLGRAGQALEQQAGKAVAGALAWFDDSATDLAPIFEELTSVAERDQARAQRMSQRVVETEQGRVKTADVKLQAGHMINTALLKYPAPVEIGEFLKGPWYASAQLVLLKAGKDSEPWQKMCETTDTLLDSLQATQEDMENRRQYIFEVVTRLPKDMRRCLLSLHHDTDAVNDAMGLIEFAHLRVLRQQPLELENIEPIALADPSATASEPERFDVLERVQPGQWFRVDNGDGEPLRVQLVLRLEREQQLLFTNQAGIKVLQQGYQEFADLLARQKVVQLHSGASFSLCLARAVGIETVEALDSLAGSAAEHARHEDDERQRQETERLQRERELALHLEREQAEAERLEREHETARRLEQEREEAQRFEQEREEALRLEREREEAQRLEREREEALRLEREREEAQRIEREREEALRLEREREEAQRVEREQQAEQLRLAQEEAAQAEEQARREAAAPTFPHLAANEPVSGAAKTVELNLPMGAWLGFHDGDTPLMAKLAVHDREQDQYIFVNREGIKMRQLSKLELLKLMDSGLVDILQTNSNFRDEVTQARNRFEP